MKKLLIATCCVCLLALTGVACALLLTVRSTVASVPGEIQATRAALIGQVEAVRIEALAEIDKQATGIRKDADRQLSGIRSDLHTELQQTTATLAAGLQVSLDTLVAPITGIRADLKPVLENTASLVKNANDSWDDSYWDVQALLGSATVATTQTAQTMQTIREATPAFLATSQETNRQIAGVVTDLHTVTSKFVEPLTVKQKIWQGFKAVALLGSHF